jgi:hypothetical protein
MAERQGKTGEMKKRAAETGYCGIFRAKRGPEKTLLLGYIRTRLTYLSIF